jgi:conjugal transfer pilus assembly protein TraD
MRDEDATENYLWLFVIALAIFFLPAMIYAVLIFLVARQFDNWRIIGPILGVSGLAGIMIVYFAGGLQAWFGWYFSIFGDCGKNLMAGEYLSHFPLKAFFSIMFVTGPPVGVVAAVLAMRNSPGIFGFRPRGPKKNSVNKGVIESLKLSRISKTTHPKGKTLLGISQTGKTVVSLADRELNQHCFLIGTTGSGKTVTLSNFAESAIQRGIPLVYVDGKGEVKLVEQLQTQAKKHGRKFYLFSVNDHPDGCRWNPLSRGRATELKDKLISLTEWSEPHYKYEAERYLQAVFTMFEALHIRPDIPGVAQYLYPKAAERLARNVQDDGLREKLMKELRAGKTVEGLANRIAVLAASEIGELFRGDEDETDEKPAPVEEKAINLGGLLGLEEEQIQEESDTAADPVPIRDTRPVLDLDQAVREKAVVLFSLNSLRFREFSQMIGRIVVNDLRGTIARRYDQPERDYVFGIFDEFHVFASVQVVDILAQARGAGFCTIIATQSLSDLDLVDRDITGRIVENCNTFIIQAQNYPENAERLAAIIGTQDSLARTYQVEGRVAPIGTGMGTWRETKEFIVHPDEIKRLQIGEAVIVRKAGNHDTDRIWVRWPGM